MKEVYICKKCGFVSTIRSEFVKQNNETICKDCNLQNKSNAIMRNDDKGEK